VSRVAVLLVLVPVAIASCVRAPNVTVVDRRTALELQAGGEHRALEMDLRQAGLKPGAAPLTRAEIEAAGLDTSASPVDEFARIYGSTRSDAEQIDSLLVRRCVGEGLEGLLVETPATCTGDEDPGAAGPVVARANRDRRQLWSWMARVKPGLVEEEVRREWRRVHLAEVVCGGQVQGENGVWEVKKCD